MSEQNAEKGQVIHTLALNVIERETGDIVAQLKFFPSEAEMPGYVEHVERGYEGTPWRTERVPLTSPAQTGDAKETR